MDPRFAFPSEIFRSLHVSRDGRVLVAQSLPDASCVKPLLRAWRVRGLEFQADNEPWDGSGGPLVAVTSATPVAVFTLGKGTATVLQQEGPHWCPDVTCEPELVRDPWVSPHILCQVSDNFLLWRTPHAQLLYSKEVRGGVSVFVLTRRLPKTMHGKNAPQNRRIEPAASKTECRGPSPLLSVEQCFTLP